MIFVAKAPMHVTYISIFNTNSTTQTVLMYISPRGGGNATQFRRIRLTENEHYVIVDRLPLTAGDEIQASTTTASAVKVVVSGETNA